eukprot:6698913-Alexandrium_andersonii.AAC.1
MAQAESAAWASAGSPQRTGWPGEGHPSARQRSSRPQTHRPTGQWRRASLRPTASRLARASAGRSPSHCTMPASPSNQATAA